jgi:DNA polymerase III subunit beta
MDLTLARASVLEELQLIQGVLERRTTIPILSNVLLTAEGDRLQLAATDLDVTVFTHCPAVVRKEGRATIQGRVFFELVRSLPTDSFELTCSEGRVEVRSATFQSQLASLDPADFPTLPEIPAGQGFALSLNVLHRAIDRTIFAVSAEEGHFQYNAAMLAFAKSTLRMVATDGHRLAFVEAAHGGGTPPFEQQLLPRKVLSQLRRLGSSDETPVYLGKGENHLAFRIGDRVLLSRILEARFPQYERVLVRDNPHRARISRIEFLSALRRVGLLTSEKTHGVQLQLDEDALSITSVGYDLGRAAEIVPCHYRAEQLEVLVNAQYLVDFLSAVECADVEIQLRDADGPVVLRPQDDDPTLAESIYVVMPIRV